MFCNFCGTQNPDNSNFCSQCGKQFSSLVAQSNTPQPKYAVEIFRESQAFLLNPPINITIDGKTNRSISNGETLTINLNSGLHQLTFSQSIRKKNIEIDLNKNIYIALKWNRLTGSIDTTIST